MTNPSLTNKRNHRITLALEGGKWKVRRWVDVDGKTECRVHVFKIRASALQLIGVAAVEMELSDRTPAEARIANRLKLTD